MKTEKEINEKIDELNCKLEDLHEEEDFVDAKIELLEWVLE